MCSAPALGRDVPDTPPDGVVTREVGGVADGNGHSGVPFDVAHLLVRLDRVDDHVGTIRVDPSLGRLRRAVRHQRGHEAKVPASHRLDESVREIHGQDARARRATSMSSTFVLGAPLVQGQLRTECAVRCADVTELASPTSAWCSPGSYGASSRPNTSSMVGHGGPARSTLRSSRPKGIPFGN
jgi:hypothetical protein